jgi:maltose alpha-D-glucosyltransferase/alpha-amylase
MIEPKPQWYKDAIIYELHVRAFQDSDGDGMGDFRGLTEKLDNLQDLGVTTIWLLPFYPSPWKDDGYDISDYTNVHPAYGTLRDFNVFLQEAHRRDLRVITELIINHTSDQHPWFQRARLAKPGSRWRGFYVWSDNPDKYKDARIIFKDFESSNWSYDPVAKAYFWHRFYSHQPDLNFDNPAVHQALFDVVDFWFKLGVDGLRLDAVPYLYEREGTSCENLPETHAFLKTLRRHVDQKFQDRMLLAEANQWPEDASAYFGEGDECHTAFHFPLMPRLFMALRMEDRYPITEILQLTPVIPDNCQWALFLRNHDELTLEMVTDEERDYMYRVYAQDQQMRINLGIRRRLAPLLGNGRRKIELLNGLLFALPGTPVVYYGDEIAMGDNIFLGDRNGVRTPMQWSADRNAGFSRTNPQRLYLPIIVDPEYHYEANNVDTQQNNPHSMLWWMKRLIALRKCFESFGRGSLEFLYPENHRVLCFVRRYKDERILVVANLSRFAQPVELDLSAFKGMVPQELFGQTTFPAIGDLPYFLTLGPLGFYWFSLEPQPAAVAVQETPVATLLIPDGWEGIRRKQGRAALEEILPAYLRQRRWFRSKARRIKSATIQDVIPIGSMKAAVLLVNVEYTDADPELYAIALTIAAGEQAKRIHQEFPESVFAHIRIADEDGILYDALRDKQFCHTLLEAVRRRRRLKGMAGELMAWPTRVLRAKSSAEDVALEPSLIKAEQSNTSVIYGDKWILKVFRRLEEGANPDLEVGCYLTERHATTHLTPALAGALEYRGKNDARMLVGILHEFVPNQGDAWGHTMDMLSTYFERALAHDVNPKPEREAAIPHKSLLSLSDEEITVAVTELIGPYLESARLLGQRTAEMHLALSKEHKDPNFTPEPFTDFYRQALYHQMLGLTNQAFQILRRRQRALPEAAQADAARVLELEGTIRKRFRQLRDRRITAVRIRCHGDYHLGQLLYTGKDFVIIDFEGEPARPLSERRIKRSALRDVAGMLRSFHYASYAALFGQVPGVIARPDVIPALEPWARFWYVWVSSVFLKTYLATSGQAPFLPRTREELEVLLDAHLLEKAVYEIAYELNNRPDWVRIPLQGILHLMEGTPSHHADTGESKAK